MSNALNAVALSKAPGKAILAWCTDDPDGSGYVVRVRRYAAGSWTGQVLEVDDTECAVQAGISAAGDAVVVWMDIVGSPAVGRMRAVRYGAGNDSWGVMRTMGASADSPVLAVNENGAAALAYRKAVRPDGGPEFSAIAAHLINAPLLVDVSSEVMLQTEIVDRRASIPSVSVSPGGDVLVGWLQEVLAGGSGNTAWGAAGRGSFGPATALGAAAPLATAPTVAVSGTGADGTRAMLAFRDPVTPAVLTRTVRIGPSATTGLWSSSNEVYGFPQALPEVGPLGDDRFLAVQSVPQPGQGFFANEDALARVWTVGGGWPSSWFSIESATGNATPTRFATDGRSRAAVLVRTTPAMTILPPWDFAVIESTDGAQTFGPLQPAFTASPSAALCPHMALDSAGGIAVACFEEVIVGGTLRRDVNVYIRE